MIPSIKGGWLPESQADYAKLREQGGLRHLACRLCAKPFTAENVQTSEGWRETQISGYCEACFTEVFANEAQESGVDEL
jgi:hypothetical protein